MNTSEFQIESADQLGATLIADKPREFIKLESFQASLESLILGYRLRGWLTDSEKQVLDCLAPEHHICFLMEGEKYLHPADCELFSYDTIRSSQSMPGEAVFQHRWEPDRTSQRGAYSIHSTLINSSGGTPITLGLLGPETDGLSIHLKERFGRLAEMTRKAWKESTSALEEIIGRFETNCPYLLVNRCSGRIMHASQSALEIFDCTVEQIVDLEFSKARTALTKVIKNYQFKMSRFTTGQYMLSSIELISSSGAEPPVDSRLDSNLIHKLKNKLTSIMSASEYIVSGANETEAKEIEEIGEMIQAEARLAERILTRMQLLLTYDDSTPVEMSLSEVINQSTLGLEFETDNKFEFRADPPPTDLMICAPTNALKTLLETVILSHVELGATSARLRCTDGPDGPILVFSSAVAHASLNSPTLWSEFACKLANLMKVRLISSHEPTTGAITTLEFSASPRTS